MPDEFCSITFHGLSREDANRIVKVAHAVAGRYWERRVIVTPSATDYVVEARPSEDSEDWGLIYGPWDQHNAFMFVSYWNRHCGWKRYRATPIMTGDAMPPERGVVKTGGQPIDLYR